MPPFRSSTARRSRKFFERTERPNDEKWVHDFAPEPAVTTRLVVSNLHWEVTENELASIFSAIGSLASKPVIRYDRSGRSTGVAVVEFSTQVDASRAKSQLDGKIAKTQAMSIAFAPQRSFGAARKSLLNRVEKPHLLARISGGRDAETKLIRSRRPVHGQGNKKAVAGRKNTTAADLDKELDAFMGADAGQGDVEMS